MKVSTHFLHDFDYLDIVETTNTWICEIFRSNDASSDTMDRHDAGIGAHDDDQPPRGRTQTYTARRRLHQWWDLHRQQSHVFWFLHCISIQTVLIFTAII